MTNNCCFVPRLMRVAGLQTEGKVRGEKLPKISGPQDCQQGCQHKERKGGQPVPSGAQVFFGVDIKTTVSKGAQWLSMLGMASAGEGSSTNYSRLRMGVAPTLAPGLLGHWHQFATISNKQTNVLSSNLWYRNKSYAAFLAEF